MTFQNDRHQRAVGQGFFHTGELSEDGTERLRYVYDCGALPAYAVARDLAIDYYLSRVPPGARLDLLFLSHAHDDHINGVPRLLASGLKVNTIVLPLMNVIDRLIAFGRAVDENPAAATDFYREFTLDPTAALGRFDPDLILYVEPGSRDGGAPGSGDESIDGPFDPGARGEDAKREPATWKLVGKGRVIYDDPRVAASTAANVAAGNRTAVMPDTKAVMVPGAKAEWLLAPFVDPGVTIHAAVFRGALAKALGMTRQALRAWLLIPANVETLVTAHASELAAAYKAVKTDLNITSLSLYSGPAVTRTPLPRMARAQFGQVHHRAAGSDSRIAWLATGDAALKQQARRATFLGHYGRLLDQVMTLTLPHHGSEGNFHPDLLDRIAPELCLVAADFRKKWRHPGSTVVQSVSSRGLFLQIVTSDPRSKTTELVTIG